MNSEKDDFFRRYRLHFLVIAIALIIVVITLFTNIFEESQADLLFPLVSIFGALVFISAILAMLSRLFKILDVLKENNTNIEKVAGRLEAIGAELAKINHSTRVSETAKAIAFRDADRQSLREAVFDKLQQQDFGAANEIITEIAQRPEYRDLAAQLRAQCDRYHDATDQERVNQIIIHIEKLLDDYQWGRASVQIEGLIKTYPESEKAKAMRQVLFDRKQDRKRVLLAAWDDAIQAQETDRSLEI